MQNAAKMLFVLDQVWKEAVNQLHVVQGQHLVDNLVVQFLAVEHWEATYPHLGIWEGFSVEVVERAS
jgi:hypothetical protein